MGWATAEEVQSITTHECSDEALALAQVMVELVAGTTTAASDAGLISSSNLLKLKRAVAFQAVWIDDHPDILTVMDVKGVSQDGLSADYTHDLAHLYSPITHLCVKMLSWRKAPLMASRRTRYASDTGNRDSAVRDDQYIWTPM